jgi:hypothetical protein
MLRHCLRLRIWILVLGLLAGAALGAACVNGSEENKDRQNDCTPTEETSCQV